ncbi:hypothetical protein Dda_1019 [Drechslerella dactyloides]|uniref:Uncharacterized protein n=1 Tax=Drechslerella dactyloides TaxID=74499 RepID=A0AAD6NMJ7_DREDA|nr:hypothetical protein Dda_1019 [Drechslerella dactyloides]
MNANESLLASSAGPSGNHHHHHHHHHGGLPKIEHLQTHFSHLAPGLKAHLTDREASTILSTADPAATSAYLTPLSNAFVNAYETGARMGLGVPLRVTLSTTDSSLVVLQSAPASAAAVEAAAAAQAQAQAQAANVVMTDPRARAQSPTGSVIGADVGGAGVVDTSRMLVGTVVAPAGELAEARVAVWAIEDVARRLQTSLEK